MPAQGEDHGRAKLSIWDVTAIRALHADDVAREHRPSIAATARAFGVDRRTVRGILQRRIWGWL